MNVDALFVLATVIGNDPSGPTPLWDSRAPDGSGSIRAALDYLLGYATNASAVWPFTQEGAKSWAEFPWTNLALQMRIAGIVYADPSYEHRIAELPWASGAFENFRDEDRSLLLWPVETTVLDPN